MLPLLTSIPEVDNALQSLGPCVYIDKEHYYTMPDEGNTASVVNRYHFEGIAGYLSPF